MPGTVVYLTSAGRSKIMNLAGDLSVTDPLWAVDA